jgi:hypothetical protein
MNALELPHEPRPSTGLSVAQRLILVTLTVYKSAFSPWFTGSCRYEPSCSHYAREAVIEHGALKGGWLALRRLTRCNPFGSYGLDPVPRARRASRS